jgi:hypothetical protein
MKVAALVWCILALLTGLVCWVAYLIGLLAICFDTCLPVSSATPQLFAIAGVTLGPGILVSLLAWILSLLYLRGQRRGIWFRILAITPLMAVVAAIPILYLTGHSLIPVADFGEPGVVFPQPLIDRNWLSATAYAIIPLMIAWPTACLVVTVVNWKADLGDVRPRIESTN